MGQETSKPQKAPRMMRENGMTPYAAAMEADITPTTLYAAIKREEAIGMLASRLCCGRQVLVEQINRTVLKKE